MEWGSTANMIGHSNNINRLEYCVSLDHHAISLCYFLFVYLVYLAPSLSALVISSIFEGALCAVILVILP